MKLEIPTALKAEHDHLHAELRGLVDAPGMVGNMAREVAKLLHPHFVKEEELALPPLGLLSRIARGDVTAAMRCVLALTERLAAEYPRMVEEHQAVVGALTRLAAAARAENRPDAERFAEALKQHAEVEEQVLYPAALLVGEFVRERLASTAKPVPRPTRARKNARRSSRDPRRVVA